MIEKNQKIMTSGKQLDTIVYPPNKPHYCVSGCNAHGLPPLKNFNEWKMFFNFLKGKSFKKWKKMKNVWTTKKDQDTIVYPDTMYPPNKHNCVSWHNFTK